MIAAILVTTQLPTAERSRDPGVNSTLSVQELVSKIAAATGRELEVSKELATIPLYVHFSDSQISSSARPLAMLLDAEWQNGRLQRTKEVIAEYREHWPEVISDFQSVVDSHLSLLRSGAKLPKTRLIYPPSLPEFAATADEQTWERFVNGKVVAYETDELANDLMLARTDSMYRYVQFRLLRGGDNSSSSTPLVYGPAMTPKFDPARMLDSRSRLAKRSSSDWHDAKFLKGLEITPDLRSSSFYSSERLRDYNSLVDVPTLAIVTRRENSYRSPGVRLQSYFSTEGEWLLLRPFNYVEQMIRHMGWPEGDSGYNPSLTIPEQVNHLAELSAKLGQTRNYPITNLEKLKHDYVVYSWPPGPFLDFWMALTSEERGRLRNGVELSELNKGARAELIDYVLFKVLMRQSTPSALSVRDFISDPRATIGLQYSPVQHFYTWNIQGVRHAHVSQDAMNRVLESPYYANAESAVWTEHRYELHVTAMGRPHTSKASIYVPMTVDTRFTRKRLPD